MSKTSPALPLWDSLPYEKAPVTKTESRSKLQTLWLAVCLPKLALEVVAGESASEISVVVEQSGEKQLVHTASLSAEKLDITAGMTLSAAYALCSDLKVYEIDKVAGQKRLQTLSAWAMQFSSKVSLHPPHSFLMEVQGSIKYFGSLAAIQEKIAEELTEKWKHVFYQATTPTSAASLMLAESGRNLVVKRNSDLRSALGELTVDKLPLDDKRKQQLNKTGVRVLRDMWRLPPGGLARRFGTDLVDYLDRALGKLPNPLPAYQQPPHFTACYEVPFEVHTFQLLLPPVFDLLCSLCDFLRQRDLHVSRYRFAFFYEQQPATVIPVGLRQPIRDPEHMMMLLETKTNQLKLSAPVIHVELSADRFHDYTTQTQRLFSTEDNERGGNDIENLLEQLYARLDHTVIKNMAVYPDHRPEYAYHNTISKTENTVRPINPRPLWLLSSPRQLLKKNDGIYYKSLINLIRGPERIESGWWDNSDIHRDYYVGIDKTAGSLWVYRDLTGKQEWYLHGLFG